MGGVLRAVAESHPGTRAQLFADDGELNRYVNVYLNDEDVRVLSGLETPVSDYRHGRDPAGDGRRLLDLAAPSPDPAASVASVAVRMALLALCMHDLEPLLLRGHVAGSIGGPDLEDVGAGGELRGPVAPGAGLEAG